MKVTYINQVKDVKWVTWLDIEKCTKEQLQEYNLRTIAENEIVLDIEDQSYAPIIRRLLEDGYQFYTVINTGSRGVHIHIYFIQLAAFSKEQRNEIRKSFIKKYGADPTKASEDTLIAAVNRPHFKTMKLATVISDSPGENVLRTDIIQEALTNLEKNKARSKDFSQDFANYHIQDTFFNYIRNNAVEDGQFRNDVIFPNVAVALVKEGLSEEEIEKLMKPIIETNFKGKSYNEFKGWLSKAFSGKITDYNKIQLNQWARQFMTMPGDIYQHTKAPPIEELHIASDGTQLPTKKFYLHSELKKLDRKTEWLIEKWITKGDICFIAGKSGSYKSTLTLHMAFAIATGKLVFDKYATTQEKVLYVNEENNDATIQNFANRVTNGLNIDIEDNVSFSLLECWRLDQDENPQELIKYIINNKITVLILDSFRRFFVGQENDATIVNLLFNNLKKLRKACPGLTILLLHHLKKGGQDTDIRDMLRGSSDIVNSADSIIGVNRKHGCSAFTMEHIKNRSGMEMVKKLIVIEDVENCAQFHESELELDEEKRLSMPEKMANTIVNWIKNNSIKVFTNKDLESLNLPHATLRRSIKLLIDEGTISQVGSGMNTRYTYLDLTEKDKDLQKKL